MLITHIYKIIQRLKLEVYILWTNKREIEYPGYRYRLFEFLAV